MPESFFPQRGLEASGHTSCRGLFNPPSSLALLPSGFSDLFSYLCSRQLKEPGRGADAHDKAPLMVTSGWPGSGRRESSGQAMFMTAQPTERQGESRNGQNPSSPSEDAVLALLPTECPRQTHSPEPLPRDRKSGRA